jgi:hypothetical protein
MAIANLTNASKKAIIGNRLPVLEHASREIVRSHTLLRQELRAAKCLGIFAHAQIGGKLIQKTNLPGKQLGSGNLN